MGTEIQWTDETWNPVTGCSKVSPGCAHCYAERVAIRLWSSQYPPVQIPENHAIDSAPSTRPREFTDVQCHDDRLDGPLRWKKPRKVFVNSMSDLFHEDVPDAFIDRVFAVMALAPQHTFQILTKRAKRMRDYLTAFFGLDSYDRRAALMMLMHPWPESTDPARITDFLVGKPLPNAWLGVSVENQRFADARIPLLLDTPASVRFISAEPLLGPLDLNCLTIRHRNTIDALRGWHDSEYPDQPRRHVPKLDWVIVGGESGAGARPSAVAWARVIVQGCQASGVPVFVKQLGANVRDRNDAGFDGSGVNDIDGRCSWPEMDPDDIEDSPDGYRDEYQGAPVRVHLGDRKGGDMSEWPIDIRVRQFPKARP